MRVVIGEDQVLMREGLRLVLEQAGFTIDEHILATREEVEAFKAEHGVDTTPQVFIAGKRVGGSSDLERFLEEESSRAS